MSDTAPTTQAAPYVPRLKDYYARQVVPQLMERYGLKNPLAAPRLVKIVLNMGIGEAVADQNAMADALLTLRTITGQQPVVTKARRSEAGFRVRRGVPLGCKVTLRGGRMYEFLDRLISIALPRVRDFRGLSVDSFDGSGNYSLGLRECVVFPELDLDKLKNLYGLDITIVTTARTDQEALELLSLFGMPFRR
ncbi:MAG: 50S ribosomal protein L5 [Candidatus Brocadiaceae bacterium]|nr:50S ribosomal protein L5 [Candidatus Brocadiaceae bacterium]